MSLKDKYSYVGLDRLISKIGSNTNGIMKFAVGDMLPYEDFKDHFVKIATDLWQMDPNLQVDNSYWALDEKRNVFIKTYDSNDAELHDRRWAVYPDGKNKKLSVSYKNDPVITINLKDIGITDSSPINTLVAQRSMLKLLKDKDNVRDLINSLGVKEKSALIKKYPELS